MAAYIVWLKHTLPHAFKVPIQDYALWFGLLWICHMEKAIKLWVHLEPIRIRNPFAIIWYSKSKIGTYQLVVWYVPLTVKINNYHEWINPNDGLIDMIF